MEGQDGDTQPTPRPNKRSRRLTVSLAPSSSSSASTSSADAPPSDHSQRGEDTLSEAGSHASGRRSPVKQLEALKDAGHPTLFCTFDDARYSERDDVAIMRDAMDAFARGRGVLAYEADVLRALVKDSQTLLSRADRKRFAEGPATVLDRTAHCAQYGSMPTAAEITAIVKRAKEIGEQNEDMWNSDVHKPILDMAARTAARGSALRLFPV